MKQRFLRSLVSFLALLLISALGLVLFALGGQLILLFMVDTLHINMYSIRFVTQLYYVVAGLVWLLAFMVLQSVLSQAARKGQLLLYTFYAVGINLIIVAVMQMVLTAYGALPKLPLQSMLTGIELLLGGGLCWAGWRKQRQIRLAH